MASRRLAKGDLKAKLWDISWIARKRFWFAVAPMTYAMAMKVSEKMGVCRRHIAHASCKSTTASAVYLVNGSGPQSFKTC